MPLTILSHQAVVLPLKLWRPHRFDGVALCTGAAAPDVVYALGGFGPLVGTHRLSALVWWSLPVATVLARLIRWAAAAVAAHLPRAGTLHLRDYGVLARVRYRWYVTAGSALLGGASHLLSDLGTHGQAIRWTRAHGIPGWEHAQVVSSALLAVAVGAMAVHIGRRRLLVRWHGGADLPAARPAAFWGTFAVSGAVLLALSVALPGGRWPLVLSIRLICVVTLAFLAAAAVVRVRVRRGRAGRVSPRNARNARAAAGTGRM